MEFRGWEANMEIFCSCKYIGHNCVEWLKKLRNWFVPLQRIIRTRKTVSIPNMWMAWLENWWFTAGKVWIQSVWTHWTNSTKLGWKRGRPGEPSGGSQFREPWQCLRHYATTPCRAFRTSSSSSGHTRAKASEPKILGETALKYDLKAQVYHLNTSVKISILMIYAYFFVFGIDSGPWLFRKGNTFQTHQLSCWQWISRDFTRASVLH